MNRIRLWLEQHQPLLELGVDALSAWLLGAGMTMVFCLALPFPVLREVSGWTVLFCSLAGTAAVTLLSRRWWALPGGLAAAALGLWIFSKTQGWEDFVQSVSQYVLWCLSGFPAVEPPLSQPSALWIWLLLGTVCCGVWLFLMRRLFSYLVTLLSAAGMMGVVLFWLSQQRAEAGALSFVSATALMGCIVTLPRVYARYLCRSDPSAVTRISVQILAVPAALICVGGAFWMVPEDTSQWQSTLLTNFVLDVGDLLRFSMGDSQGYWEFNLSTVQYQPLSDRLGGPVELSDDRIMSVKTEDPVLLKGAVQDTYTGSGWIDSRNNGRFRLESLIWSGRRQDVMGLDIPSDKKVRELYLRLTKEVTLDIFPSYYWYCTIFTPGRLIDTSFRGNWEQTVYFNDQGEVFTQEAVGAGYEVTGRVFRPRDSGMDREIELLERLAASGKKDKAYEEIQQQYLQLPQSLPDRVRQIAQEITDRETTPYQKATAISDWLSKNCIYTLTPSVPPQDRDFVDWFLETKEGYCTYYVSAMTVLARCVGIPARYVTGFGLKEDTGLQEDWYYISNATGHAWSEIYLYGIGWVPLDPLNWSPVQQYAARPDATPTVEDWTEEEEEELPSPSLTQPPEQLSQGSRYGIWALALLFTAAAVVMLILGIYRYPGERFRMRRMLRKGLSSPQWLELLYEDLLRQLRLLELSPRSGETLTEFAARVDARLPLEREDRPMSQIAVWVNAWRFGAETPPQDKLEWLCGYHDALERLVLVRLGRGGYFWKRCVPSVLGR